MSNLQQKSKKDVTHNFRWKTTGEFLSPAEMRTIHLFYVWLMVWNRYVPESMRIVTNHQHEFSDFYTPEYMLEAFRAMYIELKTRDDLRPKMRKAIERIELLYSETVYKSSSLPVNSITQR